MCRLLSLFLIISVVTEVQAQKIVSGIPLIESLLSDSSRVYDVIISSDIEQPLAINDYPYLLKRIPLPQKLVKSKSTLYALLGGTGIVYQIKKERKLLIAQRIDSTIFFGYNFGAVSFAWHDSLFSFGGYGYWHNNGLLRVYHPRNYEWEAIPLSREVPFNSYPSHGFKTWFDYKTGKLYVDKMPEKPSAADTICVLDMVTRTWSSLGKCVFDIKYHESQINTPWGILCKGPEDYTSFILLDLSQNVVRRLSLSKSRQIINLELPNSRFFFRDSTLHIVHDTIINKIPLSLTDFRSTGHSIYEKSSQSPSLLGKGSPLPWRIGLGVLFGILVGFLGAGLFWKTKTSQNQDQVTSPGKHPMTVFDEKEKALIRLIAGNSRKNVMTSIDEINKIMGLSDKAQDLQKKHRSDTISSINQKYQYITRSENLLLKKHRAEMDKRSFEYYIDFKDSESLHGFI